MSGPNFSSNGNPSSQSLAVCTNTSCNKATTYYVQPSMRLQKRQSKIDGLAYKRQGVNALKKMNRVLAD